MDCTELPLMIPVDTLQILGKNIFVLKLCILNFEILQVLIVHREVYFRLLSEQSWTTSEWYSNKTLLPLQSRRDEVFKNCLSWFFRCSRRINLDIDDLFCDQLSEFWHLEYLDNYRQRWSFCQFQNKLLQDSLINKKIWNKAKLLLISAYCLEHFNLFW